MTAITRSASRRKNDFYPTPAAATEALLDRCPEIRGKLFECCAGKGDIEEPLRAFGCHVFTNDIEPQVSAYYSMDATDRDNWKFWRNEWNFNWVVTNPPFNCAPEIVPLAYEYADRGIAILLRLSYLEPCQNRRDWLAKHPPTKLLILPRISFTGDGKTDSVCTAWMIWDKQATGQTIEIIGGKQE